MDLDVKNNYDLAKVICMKYSNQFIVFLSHSGLMCIRDLDDEMLSSADLAFSTSGITGHEVQLSPKYGKITVANREEYVKLALNYR